MATDLFTPMLGNLAQMGFFQFLLPFLLILAIVYGVLRASMQQRLDKSAAGLISVIIAFFVMNYSGQTGIAMAQFLTSIFGGGAIILTGILVIIIFLGLVGIDLKNVLGVKEGEKPKMHVWIFIIMLIFIGYLLFAGAGGLSLVPIGSLGVPPETLASLIFFIVILAMAIWWLGREEKEEKETAGGTPQRR